MSEKNNTTDTASFEFGGLIGGKIDPSLNELEVSSAKEQKDWQDMTEEELRIAAIHPTCSTERGDTEIEGLVPMETTLTAQQKDWRDMTEEELKAAALVRACSLREDDADAEEAYACLVPLAQA